jgi:membrane fusion protein (multidrug efflux system)
MSKFGWFIIGLLILIASIIIYNKVLHPKNPSSAANGANKNAPVGVNVFVVSPQSLDNDIVASGTLLAYDEIELHSEISGKIISLNINEGSTIKKGDLMVKLFDADLQAQLKKLQAQKETADKNEQRLKQLLNIKGIGEQDYDNVITQQKTLQADIDNINAMISKTEIRAPFNGTIGLKNISIGAYLTPSISIATIQNISQLKLDFTIPEKYGSVIKNGDMLQFKVDGSSEIFTAKTYAIEHKIDADTRSIKARALVQNTSSLLIPGAFAKIDVGLKKIDNALLIPTQCIIPDARFKKVAIVKNGKAEFKKVETGVRNETMIQITNGLEIGDTVITSGLLYVKPNSVLKIKM